MKIRKKLTVVTISFNQKEFIKECIESVLAQKTEEVEYIVVDPGSTDGSREIISEYGKEIDLFITEKDKGPADGLNNGFAQASGSVFYYLNSDDIVQPGAFAEALAIFEHNPIIDVVAGSGVVLDAAGKELRKITSDSITRLRLAYGGGIVIQPATFIRKSAFDRVGGFNALNKSNWDGELIVDLFVSDATFHICDNQWGGYRLHDQSITATGRTSNLIKVWNKRKREKLRMPGNPFIVSLFSNFFRLERLYREPWRIRDRIIMGRVFGSANK